MNRITALLVLIFFVNSCSSDSLTNKIELSGSAETTNIILSSQVAGTVEKIVQEEGNGVGVGDTLIIIDPETYILQLNQAEAQRDLAKAKYDLLKKGARSEDKSQVAEALNQAEANYQSAKSDFERIENLFNNQSVTKKQYDDAQTRLTIAEAQLNSAKQNLKKIENFVEIGETVNPQSTLVKITDLSEVEVVVYIQEADLGKVKLGQKAEIYSDSYEDKSYEGKVTYISPEAEFTPKNIQTKEERTKLVFAVKIKVPNPNYELKAGMPVDAVIYF